MNKETLKMAEKFKTDFVNLMELHSNLIKDIPNLSDEKKGEMLKDMSVINTLVEKKDFNSLNDMLTKITRDASNNSK